MILADDLATWTADALPSQNLLVTASLGNPIWEGPPVAVKTAQVALPVHAAETPKHSESRRGTALRAVDTARLVETEPELKQFSHLLLNLSEGDRVRGWMGRLWVG